MKKKRLKAALRNAKARIANLEVGYNILNTKLTGRLNFARKDLADARVTGRTLCSERDAAREEARRCRALFVTRADELEASRELADEFKAKCVELDAKINATIGKLNSVTVDRDEWKINYDRASAMVTRVGADRDAWKCRFDDTQRGPAQVSESGQGGAVEIRPGMSTSGQGGPVEVPERAAASGQGGAVDVPMRALAEPYSDAAKSLGLCAVCLQALSATEKTDGRTVHAKCLKAQHAKPDYCKTLPRPIKPAPVLFIPDELHSASVAVEGEGVT